MFKARIKKTKISILNSNVKSVLLQGCETWEVTTQIKSRLQTILNRCLRTIVDRRWPKAISNTEM